MTSSRQRLDTTTSWAITSSALVTTFTLGNTQISHAAILFLIFLNSFFLQVEARRFCAYEAGRYRVLLLERWFYAEILGETVDPQWTRSLIRALRTHYPRVSLAGALGWRLRRNYLWMYLTVLLVWLGKLALSGGANPLNPQFGELMTRQWSLMQQLAQLNTEMMLGIAAPKS